MPQTFDDMLKQIKQTLSGKTNPKTKKPYTESDYRAIATTAYQKKYGKAPGESTGVVVAENVKVQFNGYAEVLD